MADTGELEKDVAGAAKGQKGAGSTIQFIKRPRTTDPAIHAEINRYVTGTIADLGGLPNMSAGKKMMVLCQKVALTITLCSEGRIIDESRSLLDDTGRPHPLLAVIRNYLTVFRQGEIALGLGMRERFERSDNQTMQQIQKEYEKRNSKPVLVPQSPNTVGVKK